ncbi:hypothetical protein [Tahibacter harae]|uniref:DUF4124 domain-containing protein n=1 Tax=Tahibacter harae TaxID=2963937 RepID=A0ABT1QYG7_9GAMM|nr:hypothetical protein [Tahibacter harae]MCQ4167339.1 hypothetical protein [Tahibacter harae]
MQAIFALALALNLSLPGVSYKCRDAQGNWTAQACLSAAPLPESDYVRQQRVRQAVARQRREVRDRLSMYCFRLDTKASVYDCVDQQMLAYDIINTLAKQLGPVSPNSAKLASCMNRNLDPRSQATDYRRAMECYFTR